MISPGLRYAAIRAGLEAVNLIPLALHNGRWAGRGVVFALHHVRPEIDSAFQPNAVLSITPQFLDSALRVALEAGLVPVRLEDVPALLEQPSRAPFFAVSLDDGYRDNAEFAAPVFRRHAVPYTMFVTTGFIERTRIPWWEVAEALLRQSDGLLFDFGKGMKRHDAASLRQKAALFRRLAAFVAGHDEDEAVRRIEFAAEEAGLVPRDVVARQVMDWDELRALQAGDPLLSIGAHTLSHCSLSRVGADRLHAEIVQSGARIQSMTGVRPASFAYPYGWPGTVGAREVKAVRDAGFRVGVTTQPDVFRPSKGFDPHMLPRISLNGLFQKPRYVRALISGLPFLVR